ncbi:response regulator [Candidatus Saccharibacteria bacterium]|nr:response regulator [Candidatus Saccharibacteria bacterium]
MTKILLVEDDKSLREIYGVRLYAEGYDIVTAGDGEEALAMAIKERPALIISDVMMPKISGFDMLDILRSTTETRDIKVIMMTALSSEDQRTRGEQLGADRYLVKSQVGIEDVVRTVHDILQDGNSIPSQQFSQQQPQQQQAPQRPPSQYPQQQQQQQSTPQPQPQSGLPQPTAPFSSPRPANLGDRVIQPLSRDTSATNDVASLIEQELNQHEQPSVPFQQPQQPQSSQDEAALSAHLQQAVSSQTNNPPTPPQPQQPQPSQPPQPQQQPGYQNPPTPPAYQQTSDFGPRPFQPPQR